MTPLVWYWRDHGLFFKQGETVIGPIEGLPLDSLLEEIAGAVRRRNMAYSEALRRAIHEESAAVAPDTTQLIEVARWVSDGV